MPSKEKEGALSTPEVPLVEEDFREAVRTRKDFLPEPNRVNLNAAEEAKAGQPPPPRSQTAERLNVDQEPPRATPSPRSKDKDAEETPPRATPSPRSDQQRKEAEPDHPTAQARTVIEPEPPGGSARSQK